MQQQHHTLILGGQKSGKSRYAELMARDWLAAAPTHRATLIATACAHDSEMAERIARHRSDRAARVPQLQTQEETLAVPECIAQHSRPDTLLVVDCLTLWLTNLLMPFEPSAALAPEQAAHRIRALADAVQAAPGPVVLVSNEIGLGLIPFTPAVRTFVDQLGLLNQSLAASCDRAILMAAGLPLALKTP